MTSEPEEIFMIITRAMPPLCPHPSQRITGVSRRIDAGQENQNRTMPDFRLCRRPLRQAHRQEEARPRYQWHSGRQGSKIMRTARGLAAIGATVVLAFTATIGPAAAATVGRYSLEGPHGYYWCDAFKTDAVDRDYPTDVSQRLGSVTIKLRSHTIQATISITDGLPKTSYGVYLDQYECGGPPEGTLVTNKAGTGTLKYSEPLDPRTTAARVDVVGPNDASYRSDTAFIYPSQ